MGVPEDRPVPDALALFGDPKRIVQSLRQYLETTDLCKQQLAEWEEAKKADKDVERPDAIDTLTELIVDDLFEFGLIGLCGDTVKIKLFSGQEPFSTNGQWDDKTGAVTWSATLDERVPLPMVCYALWSSPDRAAQETCFGKVVFSGQELGGYAHFHSALTEDEASQWDSFVARLTPDADLRATIESFVFTPARPKLAESGKDLLREALGIKEDE